MMTSTEIILIIIVHFIADFIFQSESWAQCKSYDLVSLLKHTLTYSFIWLIAMVWFLPLLELTMFVLGTFLAHTITDFFTSKIVKMKFERKEYGSKIPNFGAFTTIGFDQVLHYAQLFYLYEFLK